jgi:hypothetical protein
MSNNDSFIITGKTFDFLRALCEVVLPGLAVLYAACGDYLDLPYQGQVTELAAALAVIIGAVINLSRHNYNKALKEEAADE